MSDLATQKNTAKTVIGAYNAWDLEKILACRSPDCETKVLPASMGRASRNNTEYREHMSQIIPWFKDFKVTVHTEVHDAEARTCMIHATSTAETSIGPYGNEYALILHFTEDRTKITKFLEFVDSAYSMKFFVKLAEEGGKK